MPSDDESAFNAPDITSSLSADGVLLRLRHSGFGWISFLAPPDVAHSLGQWLVENVKKPG